MSNIIYFNKELKLDNEKVLSKLGIRGRRAVELASMALPIVPGFSRFRAYIKITANEH
jgi:hypothetical protein